MQKILCLVSVILVSGLVGVDSLQCYVCFNCTTPTDANLMTCGEPETTMAPPETTPAPANASTTPALTTTSTTPAPANTSTTPAPANTSTTPAPATTATTPAPATTSTTPTPVDNTTVQEQDPHGRNRSKRSVPLTQTKQNKDEVASYMCITITEEVADNDVIARGCVPAVIDGKAPCDSEIAANAKSCITCSTDKCNGSFTVQYSAFTLAATIGLMMFE